MNKTHSFLIPVCGTAFTVDSPIKVAKYGISSVISLVDDTMIESVRKYYAGLMNEPYQPISKKEEDHRAKRITAYLNLVDVIVKKTFEDVRSSAFEAGSEITKYFELLPDFSPLKEKYLVMMSETDETLKERMQENLRNEMLPGSIDVNIMTKLDRDNYDHDHQLLPAEFSDALAALRGYAESTLTSAMVFSAGFSRRLYGYLEKFEDFYANASGLIKKKVVLKVSDHRSAMIQGRFFAKKGICVSEFRIESGLNCGGHVFPSNGFLMGPILEEFSQKKDELVEQLKEMCNKVLKSQERPLIPDNHTIVLTAQGGIATAKEDKFLRTYYNMDMTGWGTAFLVVPEATTVDDETLQKLIAAKKEDLYVSDSSPVGVLFNNLQTSPSEEKRRQRIAEGHPGAVCWRGHLVSDTEFSGRPVCVASRAYQKNKIAQLEAKNLEPAAFQKAFEAIVVKSCICLDLGASAFNKYKLESSAENVTAVCPGPSMEYFNKAFSLKEMTDHIYGRIDILGNNDRSNMFITELKLYVEHFMKEVQAYLEAPNEKQQEVLTEFLKNLCDGVDYYKDLFPKMVEETEEYRNKMLEELQFFSDRLINFITPHADLIPLPLS